jgi:hypothetical protein
MLRFTLATTGTAALPICGKEELRRFLVIVPFAPHFEHR